MRRLSLLLLAALAVCEQSRLVAQQASAESPAAMATRLLAAHAAHDWRALRASAHPDAIEMFKRMQLRLFTIEADSELVRMPGWLEHVARIRSAGRFVLDSIYRVKDVAALQALPADSVLVLFHSTMESRVQPGPDPWGVTHRVIGELFADTVAYVVVEASQTLPHPNAPDWDGDRAYLLTFRRGTGGWLSMLDGPLEFESLAFSESYFDAFYDAH